MSVDPEALLQRADWIRRLASHLVREGGRAGALDPAQAEDLAQDTLLAALESGPREGVPLGRWLAAVARNLAAGDRRGSERRRRREAGAARPETDAGQPEPGAALARLEAHRRLVEAVRALDEPYRGAILMRYFDGLAPREIARSTGEPVRTVHTRLQRALTRLRAALERGGGGPLEAWLPLLVAAGPARRCAPRDPLPASAGTLATTLLGGLLVQTKTKLLVGALAGGGLFLAIRAQQPAAISGAVAPASAAEPAAVLSRPAAQQAAPPAAGGRQPSAAPLPVPAGAPPEEPLAAPTLLVRGRAVDLEGRPVAGLHLGYLPYRLGDELAARTPPEAAQSALVTPADGSFEFPVPAPGEWAPGGRVVVLDPRWSAVLEPMLTRFGYGQPEESLLVVAPATELAGRVVDERGAGVAGAELVVSLPRSLGFELPFSMEGSRWPTWATSAGPDGAFALGAISAPQAMLHTVAGGFVPDLRPAPARSEAALAIVLKTPGGRVDRLVGTVVDAAGLPVEGARVALGYEHARSGPEGRFVLDLPPLHAHVDPPAARLSALKEGHLPAFLERQGDDNQAPDAWPEPLVLRLGGAPLELSGRVARAEGGPAPGLEVQLLSPTRFGPVELPGRVDMTTLALVEDLLAGTTEPQTVTDGEGRFTLRGLLEKPYELRVVDRQRVLVEDFGPFEAGSAGHVLKLSPPRLIPRLAGRVVGLSGQPLGPTLVSALVTRDPPSPGELAPFVTGPMVHGDEQGRFEFQDLAADVTHVSIGGPEIGFGHTFAIPPGADLEALEFRVPARCRFRVELGAETHGQFELLDADGELLTLFQSQGDYAFSMQQGMLLEGRSETLSAPETAALLVVHLPGREPLEIPVRLRPDEVTVITD